MCPSLACCTRPVLPLAQINKYAFSGGGATLEEHRSKGANLDVDVPWKYLNFFMEDDANLTHIGREYGAGRMLTGEWGGVGGLVGRWVRRRVGGGGGAGASAGQRAKPFGAMLPDRATGKESGVLVIGECKISSFAQSLPGRLSPHLTK